jgi:hypothetical protein
VLGEGGHETHFYQSTLNLLHGLIIITITQVTATKIAICIYSSAACELFLRLWGSDAFGASFVDLAFLLHLLDMLQVLRGEVRLPSKSLRVGAC